MSAAAYLAKGGYSVDLIEKHNSLGGRCRQFSHEGFHFDMGPSWYWMPEVFENFYNDFGFTTADFYDLKRLDPSYQIIFDHDEFVVPASLEALYSKFESIEAGSSKKLQKFLKSAQFKYEAGMNEYVHMPGSSILEYFDLKVLKSVFKLNMLSSVSSEVRGLFKDPRLIQLLEFPVLFLGSTAQRIPALYSLMNYADLSLGTWYPLGGMVEISKAFQRILESLNVNIHLNQEVRDVNIRDKRISKVLTDNREYSADQVVCSLDYHHFDQNILPTSYQSYTPKYWDQRQMAPSSLLFYVGLNKKISGLLHHNLFFDSDFDNHAQEIYGTPSWPQDPLFYVCCPSKTDKKVAPDSCENIFILVPLAAGLKDDLIATDRIFDQVCDRIAKRFAVEIKDHIMYKKSFSVNDFKTEYNSFKGNAYGLANTLLQTGFLKPKMKSKKITNLYYSGQLTVPGPGVPPSIISGHIAANQILK